MNESINHSKITSQYMYLNDSTTVRLPGAECAPWNQREESAQVRGGMLLVSITHNYSPKPQKLCPFQNLCHVVVMFS